MIQELIHIPKPIADISFFWQDCRIYNESVSDSWQVRPSLHRMGNLYLSKPCLCDIRTSLI